MVVMARLPTSPTGSWQERTGTPSTCTVQAPHCAIPQPNFVPVRPRTSRRTQSSGMSSGASKIRFSPLIFKFMTANFRPVFPARLVSHLHLVHRHHVLFEIGDDPD